MVKDEAHGWSADAKRQDDTSNYLHQPKLYDHFDQ
jgi:hypothetical protein